MSKVLDRAREQYKDLTYEQLCDVEKEFQRQQIETQAFLDEHKLSVSQKSVKVEELQLKISALYTVMNEKHSACNKSQDEWYSEAKKKYPGIFDEEDDIVDDDCYISALENGFIDETILNEIEENTDGTDRNEDIATSGNGSKTTKIRRD